MHFFHSHFKPSLANTSEMKFIVSITILIASTSCARAAAYLPFPGDCIKDNYFRGMKSWKQAEGTWFKIAQTSNPLLKVSKDRPQYPDTTITCSSEIRLEDITNDNNNPIHDTHEPVFQIYDRYSRGSSSDPEMVRNGKVYIRGNNSPGVWTLAMDDMEDLQHHLIGFKENDYMLAVVCEQAFHGLGGNNKLRHAWTHDLHAVLYVKDYPSKLTEERKTSLMDMARESLKENKVDPAKLALVGGLANGQDC